MNTHMGRIVHNTPDVGNNDISCGTSDADGIIIKENESGTGVYIYYSEINSIVQQMKKLLYEKENSVRNDSVSTKETNEGKIQSGYKNLSDLKEYYKTDEWQEIRTRRLRMDGFRCVNCGSAVDVEVHHLSYENLFHEDAKRDLRSLCRVCHDRKTGLDRRRRCVVVDDIIKEKR